MTAVATAGRDNTWNSRANSCLMNMGACKRVPLVAAAATASSSTWEGVSPSHSEKSGVVWLTRRLTRASFLPFEDRPSALQV